MGTNTSMTLSAYAKSRGLSQPTVSKAVAKGRLVKSVGRTETGAPCIVDPVLADLEWAQNTKTHNIPHCVRGAAQVNAAPTTAQVLAPTVEEVCAYESPTRIADRLGLPSEEDLAKGNVLERWYSAELKRVKLEELEGTLVLAAEVEAEWADILATVRTKVLGLPTALRQALPALSQEDIDVIDREVRAILSDLSGTEAS